MNKPVMWTGSKSKPVLVVIDAHRKVLPRIADLIEAARRHRVPIIFANDADNETAVAAGPVPGESATHPKKSAPWPDEYVIRPRRHSGLLCERKNPDSATGARRRHGDTGRRRNQHQRALQFPGCSSVRLFLPRGRGLRGRPRRRRRTREPCVQWNTCNRRRAPHMRRGDPGFGRCVPRSSTGAAMQMSATSTTRYS